MYTVSKSVSGNLFKFLNGREIEFVPFGKMQKTNDEDQMSQTVKSFSRKGKYNCNICEVSFDDVNEQRNHFKSSSHVSKIQNQVLDEKNRKANKEKEEEKQINENASRNRENSNVSPFVFFKIANQEETYAIYRTILMIKQSLLNTSSYPIQDITERHNKLITAKNHLWTILLYRGGYFSGAIYDPLTEKYVSKKSLHRYIIRKKQGRIQSVQDSNKKAKSAGSQIRRENEHRLATDIQKQLMSWKNCNHFRDSSLILYSVSNLNMNLFFNQLGTGASEILQKGDEKLFSLPFAVQRPCFREVQRVVSKLQSVYVLEMKREIQDEEKDYSTNSDVSSDDSDD